eukprot:CAMPEP_0174586474 /NCGR_PEP_ID=MMETSP0929-20130131/26807_1 /TAXON_ID=548131 ORGANISM="Ostreococcus mediterraneus, Strain clade-D-RCC2572" /NCGR_SAMPLE_ID=MMETSP0929 /ASSEMBLY_ACC=CAM_ASM_000573 /LENGTH=109 /DNA_ID=CAMNT_0015768491 /DNA_START=510 /DNA_END=840 /DNA_ORIENTATION=-
MSPRSSASSARRKKRESVPELHRRVRNVDVDKPEQRRHAQNTHQAIRQRPSAALQRLCNLFRLQCRPGDDENDDHRDRLHDGPPTRGPTGDGCAGGWGAETDGERQAKT